MATLNPAARLAEPAAFFTALRIAIGTEHDWAKPAAERQEVVPGANHFAARTSDDPAWPRSRLLAVIGNQNFYSVGRVATGHEMAGRSAP